MKKLILVLAGSLLLTSCAGAVPWNPQNNAGITNISFKWCKIETKDDISKAETMVPCSVHIFDGKEAGAIDLKFQMPDGTVLNLTADTVQAFEGQRIRGEVEKAISEDAAGVIESAIDTAGDLAGGGIGNVLDGDEDEDDGS